MTAHVPVALVTVAALLLYVFMVVSVGRARTTFQVPAPAVTGDPNFERLFRVQANTLEWLPVFLASLWLFALYDDDLWAAGLGAVWIVGRILYMAGYARAAGARATGFIIQALATLTLLLGALGRLLWIAVAGRA